MTNILLLERCEDFFTAGIEKLVGNLLGESACGPGRASKLAPGNNGGKGQISQALRGFYFTIVCPLRSARLYPGVPGRCYHQAQ